MSKRTARYSCSKGVQASVPESTVEELVKRTVDKAYEKNLVISGLYTHRFQVVANGIIFVIVALYEEQGKDVAHVILQSELEKMPNLPADLKQFIDRPPVVDMEG